MRKQSLTSGLLIIAGCFLFLTGYALLTWHVRRVVARMICDLAPVLRGPIQ